MNTKEIALMELEVRQMGKTQKDKHHIMPLNMQTLKIGKLSDCKI